MKKFLAAVLQRHRKTVIVIGLTLSLLLLVYLLLIALVAGAVTAMILRYGLLDILAAKLLPIITAIMWCCFIGTIEQNLLNALELFKEPWLLPHVRGNHNLIFIFVIAGLALAAYGALGVEDPMTRLYFRPDKLPNGMSGFFVCTHEVTLAPERTIRDLIVNGRGATFFCSLNITQTGTIYNLRNMHFLDSVNTDSQQSTEITNHTCKEFTTESSCAAYVPIGAPGTHSSAISIAVENITTDTTNRTVRDQRTLQFYANTYYVRTPEEYDKYLADQSNIPISLLTTVSAIVSLIAGLGWFMHNPKKTTRK